MVITKFAQSNFKINSDEHSILFDPGIFNCEVYQQYYQIFGPIDAIFATHKHPDHFDTETIVSLYQSQNPQIFSTEENTQALNARNINAKVVKVGDKIDIGPFKITATVANHQMRWGEFTGEKVEAFGLLVVVEGKRLYHTADTIPPTPAPGKIDLIFLPIGGRNVFTIEEATQFAQEVKPEFAIPMHYDAPQDKDVNPNELVKSLEKSQIIVKILKFGQSFELK